MGIETNALLDMLSGGTKETKSTPTATVTPTPKKPAQGKAKLEYEFIGHNTEGKSDKVWVSIKLSQNKYLACWGRRTKKLSTKVYEYDRWKMDTLIRSKTRKGYVPIDKNDLDSVYPEFESDLQKTTVWTSLTL